eukprot:COSAG05_NODE_7185_length_845_cov_0.950402_1_plen_103_part_00
MHGFQSFSLMLRNSATEPSLQNCTPSLHFSAAQLISHCADFAADGFGGGDEIGHNLVFSSCRESGDHGPFNSWDRQPYLTTVRTGQPDMIMQVNKRHATVED